MVFCSLNRSLNLLLSISNTLVNISLFCIFSLTLTFNALFHTICVVFEGLLMKKWEIFTTITYSNLLLSIHVIWQRLDLWVFCRLTSSYFQEWIIWTIWNSSTLSSPIAISLSSAIRTRIAFSDSSFIDIHIFVMETALCITHRFSFTHTKCWAMSLSSTIHWRGTLMRTPESFWFINLAWSW